jgi:hypothetical protein
MNTQPLHVDEISVWSWVAIAVFAWVLVVLLLLAPRNPAHMAGPITPFADPSLVAPQLSGEPRA